jgi:hypothetical protein
VFEVTSHSTRREDEIFKPGKYAQIGVQELFLYDLTADYLDPPLQGICFEDNEPIRITPDASGSLACETLGLQLRLDNGQLVVVDAQSSEELLTQAEAALAARDVEREAKEAERAARELEQQRREEAEARADADRAARDDAEARAEAEAAARRAAEEELHRLRDQLRQQGDPS